MTWTTFWYQLLAALITLPVVIACAAYIVKKFIGYGFDRQLASHEHQLEHQTKTEIAKIKREGASELVYLRSELNISTKEREVEYAWLHAERAKAIDEIYQLLVEAEWAAQAFANAGQYAGADRKQQYVTATDAFVSFYRTTEKRRIYLPAEFADKLNQLNDEARKVLNGLGIYTIMPNLRDAPDGAAKEFEAWMKADEYFKAFAANARRGLEEDVRRMMGDRHKD